MHLLIKPAHYFLFQRSYKSIEITEDIQTSQPHLTLELKIFLYW